MHCYFPYINSVGIQLEYGLAFRSDGFHQCLPAVSDTAYGRQVYPALVWFRPRRLVKLTNVFPISIAGRIRLRALTG